MALENAEAIRKAHNQAAASRETSTKYHFIAYTHNSGKVYELDGLKSGPGLVGFLEEGKDWVSVASLRVNDAIRLLADNNCEFHLFALVPDRTQPASVLHTQAADNLAGSETVGRKAEAGEKWEGEVGSLPREKGALQSRHGVVKERIGKAEAEVQAEEERRQAQCEDIKRRSHDYIPFLLGMLNAIGRYNSK